MSAQRENRSIGRYLGRWGYRVILWPIATILLLVLIARFAPVPSTLMLARWLGGQPVERQWVSFDAISPNLVQAVVASEDQRFCEHWGVDFDVLSDLISDTDGPDRGGSTISMQTVKNVYLWHGRSYIRKAIEIPLALVADSLWGKRRTMEIYLNIAEWGEGIFGAEAAARRYFGKSARALSPVEASRLAAALPNPIERAPGRGSRGSQRVLQRMPDVLPYLNCLQK
jgi:monofunctional biosynthetic peptidoglycan transglycosylase